MELARSVVGKVRVGSLIQWRSIYDFDAPGLSVRERLSRLEYAAWQARRRCLQEEYECELDYALDECEKLLSMETLDGEVAEQERVHQRMERIRRVVSYHEGAVARLNRRYWWVPCSMAFACIAFCCVQSLAGL